METSSAVSTHDLLFGFVTHIWTLVQLGQRKHNTIKSYASWSGLVPAGFKFKPTGAGTKNFSPIFDRPAAKLRPKELRHWMTDIALDVRDNRTDGVSPGTTTANRCLELLHAAFKWGISEELIPMEIWPTKHVERFKEAPRSRFLEPHEVEAVRQALFALENERLHDAPAAWHRFTYSQTQALLLISVTGMRLQEAMTLRTQQVDLGARLIRLPDCKVGFREVPLADVAIEQLREQLLRAEDGWVFPSVYGGPIRDVYHVWDAAIELSGIDPTDVVVHTFRHSVATYLLRRGWLATDVQNILGHHDLRTTLQIYGRPFATDSARAAINFYGNVVAPTGARRNRAA